MPQTDRQTDKHGVHIKRLFFAFYKERLKIHIVYNWNLLTFFLFMEEEYRTTGFSRLLHKSKLMNMPIIIFIKAMTTFACIEPQQVACT
jgi:hypothetical protein